MQRFKFYNRVRVPGESIAAFVASLRKIAEHCEYKDTLKDMLRDHLVCGVNHDGIQRKLLAEKNLTYDKALEIALTKTMETAEQGTKDLKAREKLQAPGDLHYTSQKFKQQRTTGKPNAKTPSAVTCHRCLGEHLASSCKFCSTECFLCKKVGHIAKACKSKQKGRKGHQDPTKTTHFMQEEDNIPEKTDHTEQERSYGLFTIQGNSANPILAKVNINQIPVEMEVDTGASLSLINKATYDLISRQSHTQALQKTDVQLKTYTGEAVCILGTAKVQVNYGEQNYQLLVYVVDGKGPNLMGRDWLGSLNLTVGVINSLSTPVVLPEVLQKLGLCDNGKSYISIKFNNV